VKESTEWLIKHRGGGPFGAGRLQTPEEILELERTMLEMVEVIRYDTEINSNAVASTTATTTTAPAPQKQIVQPVAEPMKPLPPLSQSMVSPPPVATTTRPPVSAVAPPTPLTPLAPPANKQQIQQQPAAAPATPVTESSQEVIPIAVGLDRFLAAPEKASLMEMQGLRDGLIECLSLLQKNIQSRIAAGETVPMPGMPAVSGKII
jgi:hypothetical protein